MTVNKKPRVMISAGHGLGSRQKGKVDPGASVKKPTAKDVQSEDSRDGVIDNPDSKGFVGDEGVTLEDS